jgi:phosphopantetheinyl transferase
MLIIEKNITPNQLLLVWKITEPLDFFTPYLPDEYFNEVANIKNENIKIQKAIKYYLLHLKNINYALLKDENGKPFLNNHIHLSVSHSNNLAGILISSTNCGMDIEKINEKVVRVRDKFLNENERNMFSADKETLTLLWSSKESLYKLYNINGLDYKNTITIFTIDYSLQKITASVNNNTHTLYFERYEDYFLTFTF